MCDHQRSFRKGIADRGSHNDPARRGCAATPQCRPRGRHGWLHRGDVDGHHDDARPCRNLIKSSAVKKGITVLTVSSSRMLMAHGFLKALFEVFDRHRTSVDMVAPSEVSVSLTLDSLSSLDAILEDLRPLGDVEITSEAALICLVGNNLKYTPGVARRAFGSLSDINVLMVSHGASNINFSFIVDEKDATTAVRRLHADFFSDVDPEVFEPAG